MATEFPYPPKPWYDGQEVTVANDDGTNTVTVATYDQPNNTWHITIKYQDVIDQYIYTDHVLTLEQAPYLLGLQATTKELNPLEGEPAPPTTQQTVNQFLDNVTRRQVKATGRVGDQVDFLQNTIGKGTWIHTSNEPQEEITVDNYPGPTEFWTKNLAGNWNEDQFLNVTQFIFNDTGAPGFTNPGSFEGTRIGDYLIVQENDSNHFGYYVITGQSTEVFVGDDGEDDIIRTFDVIVFRDIRAFGDVAEFAHVSVSTTRPVFTIVQDNQPFVSDRGVLWYRESDDVLSISNYADGFTGVGPQWTEIGGGGSAGSDVSVGEEPPEDADNGALWFCTEEDDGTLYVNIGTKDEPQWVAAAPPVRLDGITGDISVLEQNVQYLYTITTPQDNFLELYGKHEELAEGVDEGFREQTSLRSRIGDVEFGLQSKIDNTGNNQVAEVGGEWRIQGKNKTYIKVDDNANTVGVFNLQPATEDHHAISRGWAKDHTVQLSGDNKVANDWKIQSGEKTHFHVKGGTSRIYYLQEPTHPQHPVTLGHLESHYATKAEAKSEMTWKWHHPSQNTVGKGSIFFVTNDIGSVTTIRIATESMDGRKVDINNFSYSDKWKLPFTIYTEDENGIKIIAAGVSSHAECKTFSGVQVISLEFTNAKDMMNWRRDSIPTETPVKVKIAGLLP